MNNLDLIEMLKGVASPRIRDDLKCCDISDLFEKQEDGTLVIPFGCCYQFCTRDGNSLMGSGSPTILYDRYPEKNVHKYNEGKVQIKGTPEIVLSYQPKYPLNNRELYFTLFESKVIVIAQYAKWENRGPCILAVSKDIIKNGGYIDRCPPRPFVL
ncbi:MAG: hypothetical protein V1906_03005 [Candidatus Woesearchaeota archaeon]